MKMLMMITNHFFLLLCISCLVLWCEGEGDFDVAPMKKAEQAALYSAIQGFVGNWWNGSDLYPDPCGWTPIQVLLFYFLILWNLHNCIAKFLIGFLFHFLCHLRILTSIFNSMSKWAFTLSSRLLELKKSSQKDT